MKHKTLCWMTAVMAVLSGLAYAEYFECDSCGDCTAKIAAASAGDVLILQGDVSSGGGDCITFVNKTGVTLDCAGYSLTGAGSGNGIYLRDSDENIITSCDVGSFDTGLNIYRSADNWIVENSFSGNRENGVYIISSGGGNLFEDDLVEENGRYGMYIEGSDHGDSFEDCSFVKNRRDGVYISSTNGCNTFHLNRMELNWGNGVQLTDSGLTSFSDNVISSNSLNGVYVSSANAYLSTNHIIANGNDGLHVPDTALIVMTCNRIISNGNNGVYLYAVEGGSSISGNLIQENAGYGIYLRGELFVTPITISNNVVVENGWKGIYSYVCTWCTLSGNQVSNNGGYGLHGTLFIGDISSNCFCNNARDVYVYYGSLGVSDRCRNILGSWHDSGYSRCKYGCGSCSTSAPSCPYGMATCSGYVTTSSTTSTTTSSSTSTSSTSSTSTTSTPPTTMVKSVELKYNVTDDYGLSNCSLWTNISGSWALEQTDHSVENDQKNQFLVDNVPVGTYRWDVQCVDGSGNRVSSLNGPYRFTIEPEYIIPGDSDIVLVTDLSRSMRYCLDGSKTDCSSSNCPLGHSSDCTAVDGYNPVRFELAKKLSKEFIDRVLSRPGNRIGLVGYAKKALTLGTNYTHSLSTDAESLKAQIEAYVPGDDLIGGGTCTCCAVRRARLLLEDESPPGRNKYFVILTDGVANEYCYSDPSNTYAKTSYVMCCPDSRGRSDASPGCSPRAPYALHYSFTANFRECRYASYTGWYKAACRDVIDIKGIDQAVSDACTAYSGLNVAIYTIGMFDPAFAAGCIEAVDLVSQVADCGNGQSFIGTSRQELEDIYQRF